MVLLRKADTMTYLIECNCVFFFETKSKKGKHKIEISKPKLVLYVPSNRRLHKLIFSIKKISN